MVEGARLESVYTGNRIAGSNPASSAKYSNNILNLHRFYEVMGSEPTLHPTSVGR